MTPSARLAFLVLAVLAAAPSLQAQRPPEAAAGAAAAEPHDPRVLPGDLVRIKVWRESDMDGDYLVDPFGVVTLPLVGDLDVRGETQRSLKARLQEAYAREIRDLSLTVLVLKRIRVSGEVRVPGIFPMEPTTTVADALVMAGGRSDAGRWHEFVLRRGGETLTIDALGDDPLYRLALETGDEILVLERSWISRNAAAVLGSGVGLVGILLALVLR